jgi:hypothetical protein
MDNAVALVRAYLHVNGYFTVTEYPVVGPARHGSGYRSVTDLDVLAFRFPGAGVSPEDHETWAPDPELGCPPEEPDMLVGEVKEGHAELNEAARDPAALRAVLIRFGCCPPAHAESLVQELLRKGTAHVPGGHRVRLIAFGGLPPARPDSRVAVISLGHVVEFLQAHLRRHWEVLRHAQSKDPALGFLMTLEKARRGWEHKESQTHFRKELER